MKVGDIVYLGFGAKEDFGTPNVVCVAKVKIIEADRNIGYEIKPIKIYIDTNTPAFQLKNDYNYNGVYYDENVLSTNLSIAIQTAIKGLFTHINK